jgi:hypothetical protein
MQLILWFFFNSYRIYAGKLFNLDFLGELGLAFTFASQFCSAFDSVITQIYQPDFYRLIDNVPEEKKMENFGVFLKEVLPVYLIFLVVGFFPYVVSFQLLLKPNFSVDTTLLLTAWIFNFIRISFNVFGLITQVKLNPKMVSKYVFWGVGLSAFIFSVMYAFNLPITRNSFLLIIGSIPVVVLIFFIHNIGKRLNQLSIISRFFLNLIICVLIYFLLIKLELSGIVVKNHQAIIVMIACLFLAILGIQMLVLPKKLKAL